MAKHKHVWSWSQDRYGMYYRECMLCPKRENIGSHISQVLAFKDDDPDDWRQLLKSPANVVAWMKGWLVALKNDP